MVGAVGSGERAAAPGEVRVEVGATGADVGVLLRLTAITHPTKRATRRMLKGSLASRIHLVVRQLARSEWRPVSHSDNWFKLHWAAQGETQEPANNIKPHLQVQEVAELAREPGIALAVTIVNRVDTRAAEAAVVVGVARAAAVGVPRTLATDGRGAQRKRCRHRYHTSLSHAHPNTAAQTSHARQYDDSDRVHRENGQRHTTGEAAPLCSVALTGVKRGHSWPVHGPEA